jgi:SAM-dependent methyltransferase
MEKNKENYWSSEDYFTIEGELKLTALHPELLRVAGDIKGKKVLDFGCGDGVLSAQLANAGANVLGVDTSLGAIRRARTLYSNNRKLRFEHINSFDCNLIMEESPFDLLIISLVLGDMDYQNIMAFFKFMSRVISDGRLLLAENHPLTRDKEFSTCRYKLKPEQYRMEGALHQVEIWDGYSPDRKTQFIAHHYSLSALTAFIDEGGFLVKRLHELYDKVDIKKLHPDVCALLNKNDPVYIIIDAVKA